MREDWHLIEMFMTGDSITKIRNYLLGNLTAEEETSLEELYFSDPDYVAELWAVFADLSEQYQSRQLSESERSQFERRLERSPMLREMFENEKALFAYAASAATEKGKTEFSKIVTTPPPGFRWLRWWKNRPLQIAALSFGILLTLGFWLIKRSVSVPATQSDQIAVNRKDDAVNQTFPQPSFDPSPTLQPTASLSVSNQTNIATFFLSAQMFRSETDAPVISVPKPTREVRLELELTTGDFSAYSATLQNESGETIRQWSALSPQRSANLSKIVLRFPAALLAESGYVVKLKPVGNADAEAFAQQFRFTVERR